MASVRAFSQECRAGIFFPSSSILHHFPICFALTMSCRFSSDSAVSSLSRVIRVSAVAVRDYDASRPNQPWGEAYRFDYKTIRPNVWLCVGLSYGPLDYTQWYFGAGGDWFSLGYPIEVWQDAVVITCSIPGRLLIIPDAFFTGTLPHGLRIQKLLMRRWLPSISELVTF